MSNNVTYLGRDIIVDEEGKYRVVPDWKLFTSWGIKSLEPFEYNDFGFKSFPKVKVIVTEHAADETPFKYDPGADGQWVDIQEYLTQRNEGKVERNIAFDYSYELALKRSTALVGYTVNTEVPPKTGRFEGIRYNTKRTLIQYESEVTLDITGLNSNADEARDRTRGANHSRRQLLMDKKGNLYRTTHIGTDPYTHKWVGTKGRRLNYDFIRVDGQVIEDALEPLRKFYGQFNMHKHNFQGYVNKKSDGRSLTGYPDPKTGEFLQQNRHNSMIIIQPNVKIQDTTHTVKFSTMGGLQQDKELSKVTRGNDCECGCNVKVKDMRRGEVVCPSCGLVFHRDTIVG
jgi:hypothetical protein